MVNWIDYKFAWIYFCKIGAHILNISTMHLNILEFECFKYDNLSQIVLHRESSIGSIGSWVSGFRGFIEFLNSNFFLKTKPD